MKNEEGKAGTKALVIILVILIIAAGGVLGYKIIKDKENQETAVAEENIEEPKVEEKPKADEDENFDDDEIDFPDF